MLFLYPAQKVAANTAGASANLISDKQEVVKDKRTAILRSYLEKYNSPLVPYAHNFIEEADRNNIDWKLVPAITGVESYFGQMIPPYSYNGWGFGVYGPNVRRFSSWIEGITVVSKALRTDYMNNWGATNVYEIGSFYAADPAWGNKVSHFIAQIEESETTDSNTTLPISL